MIRQTGVPFWGDLVKQSHQVKNWCIMAYFKLLTVVIHKRYNGCDSKFARLWLKGVFCRITSLSSTRGGQGRAPSP